MTKNMKTPRRGIVTAITLVLRTIAKKDAHSRVRRELGALNGRKNHKVDSRKSASDHMLVHINDDTHRVDSRKDIRRSAVDEIN